MKCIRIRSSFQSVLASVQQVPEQMLEEKAEQYDDKYDNAPQDLILSGCLVVPGSLVVQRACR